jgi:arylsulfatase A-like enzyme
MSRFEQWLSYHYRENLFAWLQLSDPLNPSLEVSVGESALEGAIAGAEGRGYGARVVALDEALGELIERLEMRGLLERTVIAIVGTRGVVPGSGRRDVSEPWTQVPVLLYGAGLDLQREVSAQVRLHDLYPTLLAAVGLVRPPRGDAVSLVPLIQNQDITPLQSLTVGGPRPDGLCSVALRTEKWKYVRQAGGGQSLYDLRRDPRELHDISETDASTFEAAAGQVTDTLGPAVPSAVLPRVTPGRAARLRALETLR